MPSPTMRDTGLENLTQGKPAWLPGTKYLLAIGIDEFDKKGRFLPLQYPARDAAEFANVLKDEYGFDEAHIVTALNKNSTEKKIRNNIIEIKNLLKPEDSLVVFFAGHGAAVNNNGYWIAYDAEDKIELNLSVSIILDLLIGCCAQVLLIVDSCFSGATTEMAYPKAVFAELNTTQSKFSVITSGSKFDKVPDKSVFMETFLDILKTKNVTSLEGLIGDIKSGLDDKKANTTLTCYSSNDQLGLPFLLQRKDSVSYELTNSFFELNFTDQVTQKLKSIRLFNLIYLRGTKESGHHIFTQRYFREAGKNSVTMFNYIPYTISFGKDFQSPDYSLWKQLAKIFGFTQPDPSMILEKILKEIESKNWLLIAKLDGSCDEEAMEQALMDFWEKVNNYLITKNISLADYANSVYFFIWDRRGNEAEDILKENKWKQMNLSPLAKLLHLPPVKELDINNDLVDWHYNIQLTNNTLRCEKSFAKIDIPAIKSPHSIENVICQITSLCNRREVYDNLFIKKNLWIK